MASFEGDEAKLQGDLHSGSVMDPLCDEDGTHGMALFFCSSCESHFCPACDADAHDGTGPLSRHTRVEFVLRNVTCNGKSDCPNPATVECVDRCGYLCAACDTEKHAKGVKAKHPPRKPLSRRVRN